MLLERINMELMYAVLYAVIAIISIVLYVIKHRMSYWKKRGVPHDEPVLFFGNMSGVTRTKHISEPIREAYNKHKCAAPFCGFYFFIRPGIILTDLELVKRVLIKDFNNFVDRGIFHNERDDPLSGHLFALDGNRWRELRQKLSPTFTSGKMKFMFPTVIEVGHRFAKVFSEVVGKGALVEVKELLTRFTTDIIGTCAFGIECNSLMDPESEFRTAAQIFFNKPRHNPIMITFIRNCPKIARALRCKIIPNEVHTFFMRVVRETVDYREKNGIVRNDFMNLLIDLKNNKSYKTENGEVISGLTMEEMTAQAFVFYLAGFETSSSTMGFALYELASNQEIQNRLRKEVNYVLEKHNGILSYESMKDMCYMDQVIFETLRKYPIIPILNREAKEDYIISGSEYKIEKGTMVVIPVDAIHHDPEIYPNPEVFDPERFSREEVKKRDPVAWLPFGDGPRNCIGLRFGKMQSRVGLSLLIKNFEFHVSDKMKIPLEFEKHGTHISSKGGILLTVKPAA